MATVLFSPIMFNLAEVTRMIEIARALDQRHTPIFFGYEDDYRHLVTDAGFDYRPLQPAWTAADRLQALKFDQLKTLRTPFTTELVAARVAAERELIRDTEAQAVVIGTNVTSMISARAEKTTLWYAVPFALTRPHVQQTRRLGLVCGTSRWAQQADKIATSIFRWAYNHAPLAPPAFARVARDNGLPATRTIVSLLEADRNLLTVMPAELDGYKLPGGYERVGPVFAHLDSEIPPIIYELAERDEPLVYLGLGSSANRDLALAAARQLSTLPVNVVAPIRHYLSADDDLPSNVQVTELLPAHRLGGLIDAAVLHGGQGTVQTACATGVPFVGMGLQPEQVWNVNVCVAQGNAIAVSPSDAGTSALPAAVHQLLEDESFRQAARRVQRDFAAENGAVACARLIDDELSRPTQPTNI